MCEFHARGCRFTYLPQRCGSIKNALELESLADVRPRFNELERRTIRQAIEERRMEIAVQRLKTTDWPVGRVSASCGYADIRVFEAAFRRRFKTSPRTFRERHR